MDASAPSDLRNRLLGRKLGPYRSLDGYDIPWESSPAASDASLERFVVARKGNVAMAADMFASHLTWRRRVFPIARDGEVARILDDGQRFLKIGTNSSGQPVLMVNFLWGYFLEDVSALDCLRATLIFLEEQIAAAESNGVHQAYVLSYGGPPPLDYAAALSFTLDANYPERLARAVIYPVPAIVARFVRMMLWFMDKHTREKVQIESDEENMLMLIYLRIADIPEFMQGGLVAVEEQLKSDSHQRIARLLREGIYGGRSAANKLQEQLLIHDEKAKALTATSVHSSNRNSGAWSPAAWSPAAWLCCCVSRDDAVTPRSAPAAPAATHQLKPAAQKAFPKSSMQNVVVVLAILLALSLALLAQVAST